MHPPLTPANHPLCGDVIAALTACHSAHPVGKLFGACNDPKWALDACFKAEARHEAREIQRALALEGARLTLRARVPNAGAEASEAQGEL